MDIRVLRIDNSELKDIEIVLEKIQNYFSYQRISPSLFKEGRGGC